MDSDGPVRMYWMAWIVFPIVLKHVDKYMYIYIYIKTQEI